MSIARFESFNCGGESPMERFQESLHEGVRDREERPTPAVLRALLFLMLMIAPKGQWSSLLWA